MLALIAVVVALAVAGDDRTAGVAGRRAGGDVTTDFCGALKGFQDDFGLTPTRPTDPAGYIKTLKDAADKLDDVGTPDDMPDDAKDGFDLTVTTIRELPDDATLDDLAKIGDVSDADQKKIDALEDYIAKECPDLSGELRGPGAAPSALTELELRRPAAAGRSRSPSRVRPPPSRASRRPG